MEIFPEVLRLEAQAYMKPSEILSEYPIEIQKIFLSDNNQAWKFWTKQARVTFGLSPSEFEDTSLEPYERYLQLYINTGKTDYGCERHKELNHCVWEAVKEGDIQLLEYFFEKVKESKGRNLPNLERMPEYKVLGTIGKFVNFYSLGEVAGEAPNFLEVLSFLIANGLDERGVDVAWLIHFLKSNDYKRAASLISNDRTRSEYPLANQALDYAIRIRDFPLMKKLVQDFKIEDRGDYIMNAVDDDDPELLHFIIETFYPSDINTLTAAYEDARKFGANKVISWIKEKYPQRFGHV